MKKLTGLLICITLLFVVGIAGSFTVFAADGAYQDYLRVGIKKVNEGSSFDVKSSDGLNIYEYNNGSLGFVKDLKSVTDAAVKLEGGSVKIFNSNGGDQTSPVHSYADNSLYFFGSADMENGMITVSGKKYRGGILLFRNSSNAIYFINIINLEKYLYGVLPKEMSYSYPLEALKAQAVAARSFALGSVNKHKSLGYDVCSNQCCQTYGGVECEAAKCTKAVEDTKHQVAYYDGKPASLYYSANNGGYIEDSKDVWGSSVGYLKAKKDDYNPQNNWKVSFTKSELQGILQKNGYSIGELQSVRVTERSQAGSVAKLEFIGSSGTASVPGSKIRGMLGSNSVKSLKFDIAETDTTEGAEAIKVFVKSVGEVVVEKILGPVHVITANSSDFVINNAYSLVVMDKASSKVISAPSKGADLVGGMTISGKGNGHGVGMSQTGAKEMADKGMGYMDILNFYFEGITIN